MTRPLVVLAAIAALTLVLLAACGEAEPEVADRPTATPTLSVATSAPAGPAANTVVDMGGRFVEIPASVETIVALSGTATDLALALGLEVIGRPSDVDPTGDLATVAAVGSTLFPDFNAVADLSPDLVLADVAFHEGRRTDFARFPIPVFMVSVRLLDDVPLALTALGGVSGHEAEASAAVASYTAALEAVRESLPEDRAATTVLILSGAGRDIYAASNSTYLGSMVTFLDATNVLGDDPEGAPLPGFGLVEPAHIGVTDPDVVLMLAAEEGGITRELLAVREWNGKKAIVNDRLYELDINAYLRVPGPHAPEALAALVPLIYPR